VASKARAQLREAMALFGYEGHLVVFKNCDDPPGDSTKATAPAPRFAVTTRQNGRPPLRDAAANTSAGDRGVLPRLHGSGSAHPRQPPC
jgi:hypothetical protein